MPLSLKTGLVAVLAFVAAAAAATPRAPARDLSGVWSLTKYEGNASIGRSSGQLLCTRDRFSLVYTMVAADGALSARGHAGGYRVEGDEMVFHVDWDVHYVEGKGTIAPKPYTARAALRATADTMTLTFSNGATQEYRRAASAK